MATQPTLTWQQYQALPPEQRQRGLTPAEYAALTRQQRISAGLSDDDSGAPADFSGPVFPNPNHVQVSADTDSGIPPLRLPNGVTANVGAYRGQPKMDASNPAAAQVIPAQMQTIGANFSPGASEQVLSKENSDATVPMYTPDGKIRYVPFSQVNQVRAAGAKMTVRFKDPNGVTRFAPADQAQALAQHGAQILPLEDQAVQHPGFWAAVGSDLAGMAKSAATPENIIGNLAMPGLYSTLKKGMEEAKLVHETGQTTEGAHATEQKKAGYPLPYRVLTPVAENLGMNVRGSEQAAAEGDTAGVAGHAAVPAAMAVAPLAAEGASKALQSDAARSLAESGSKTVRAAARGANKALAKAPGTIGAGVGATVGAATHIPYGAEVGAGIGSMVGREILPEIKLPGESFGLPKTVSGGPKVAPQYIEPIANAAAERAAQAETVGTAEGAARDTELFRQARQELGPNASLSQVAQHAQQMKTSGPAVKLDIDTSPKAVGTQLNKALEGRDLVPGVSIKNQPAAMRAAAGKLPEGFTAHSESSWVKGTKYDPAAHEFEYITKDGQHYVRGDVGQAAADAFEKKLTETGSAGKAMDALRKHPEGGVGQFKVMGGQRVPVVKPGMGTISPTDEAPGTAPPEISKVSSEGDLTSQLQKSLNQVKAKKGGVMTTADPEMLTERWGVTEQSLKSGREQTRGWTPTETEADIKKLEQRYRKGEPVQPVMETRDQNNNLIDVDGRGRAIAAKRAGIKRIPIIVRRLGVAK